MTDKVQRSSDYCGLFRVGDICLGKNFTGEDEYNGMECEIIGALGKRKGTHIKTGHGIETTAYLVRWADGETRLILPYHLAPVFLASREYSGTTWEKFIHLTGVDPRINPKRRNEW